MEKNRAARAARISMHFFAILHNTTRNHQILSPLHTWGKSWANCLARRFAHPFFLTCAGKLWWEIRLARQRQIPSRQIPHCLRPSLESSWAKAWFHQASNKNTWHTHVSLAVQDGVGGRKSDVTEDTWECHVFLLDAWSSTRFSRWLHTMTNLPREAKKYQTCLIFSSQPREANFSPKVPRTCEETAEQTDAFCSAVCGEL